MRSWTLLTPAPGLVLGLAATEDGICRLSFTDTAAGFLAELKQTDGEAAWQRDAAPLLAEVSRQLKEYVTARRKQFQLPLDLRGTPFQRKVWGALLEIPYGETRTYAQVASRIGAPLAVRAVGAANGANPVAIIVPCHRVVSSGGGLGGYGGGLDLKRRLLALESGACQGLFDPL